TLLLSRYVLPEQLYPWLNLVAGLLVLVIGAAVLRSRIRRRRPGPDDHDHHDHAHHKHHRHADHGHHLAPHRHERPSSLSWRSLVAMGASAGLIPCPSALVVLLGALAQHQVALGLLLIVAFSIGLATTLSVLGLAVVWMGALSARINLSSPVMAALPSASALVIVGVGCVLTAQAIPHVL
ncbi:MAG: nickel/cobalt transporter (NicO) family protein, partial [Solirubrobacteraceae bacterium]|nr:nickel/cobalt transporter (NicO) family protein [Solirubrobacteraceae bacterium]